jgi:hypothetical protein
MSSPLLLRPAAPATNGEKEEECRDILLSLSLSLEIDDRE